MMTRKALSAWPIVNPAAAIINETVLTGDQPNLPAFSDRRYVSILLILLFGGGDVSRDPA